MILSCRTGPLRAGRSLRDFFTGLAGAFGFRPPVGREDSVVAAKAVDETAVAFGRAFGRSGEV
jgi:hypothetical protein